jgi:uncharacterized membrane protein (UPF0127 family)
MMRIVNRTRATVLGSNVRLADTGLSRLRGFLLRSEPRAGEGLLLTPCNAIHTWGLRFPLDVVFLDAAGRVLRVIEWLPPRTVPGRVPGGRYVLELPAGTIEATGTAVGDACSWTRTSNPSLRIQEI